MVSTIRLPHAAILFGVTIVIFLASILVFASFGLFLNIPVNAYSIYFAIVAWATTWMIGSKHYLVERRTGILATLAISQILIVGGSLFLSGRILDLSFDGQWYHQEAIFRMKEGWNPVKEYPFLTEYSTELIINTYAKGSWMISAAIYDLTGNIETAKAPNIILIIASFALTFAVLSTIKNLSKILVVILAILTACNPVSLYQVCSFYIDGQVYSLMLCLSCLIYLVIFEHNNLLMLGIIASTVLLINTKFTAIIYLFIILLSGLFWFLMTRRKWVLNQQIWVTVCVTGILIFVTGFNPYITNTINYKNPFYPILFSEIEIMENNRPANFQKLNRVEKLTYSIFSQSQNAYSPLKARLKIPFTLASDPMEFNSFDIRVGGFGPLFSGALLLAMLLIAIHIRKREILPFLYLLGILVLSTLSTPEGWWARYAPQFWILPLMGVLCGFILPGRIGKLLAAITLIILCFNVYLVAQRHFSYISIGNRDYYSKIETLAIQSDPTAVEFGIFRSEKLRLEYFQIPYVETTITRCAEVVEFTFPPPYGSYVCLEKQ